MNTKTGADGKVYEFTLEGIAPLLMHADDIERADALDVWRKDPQNKGLSKAGDDRSPAWTWQSYTYLNDQGVLAWPSANLFVALRTAGAQMILKKQKTFKELTQSGMFPHSEYFEFYFGAKLNKTLKLSDLEDMARLTFKEQAEEARKMGFQLWAKRAKVGTSKHIRIRPRFADWAIRGRVEVMAEEITPDVLKTLFQLAGRGGLGDWRPSGKTPGPYGLFGLTSLKETAK